MFWGINFERIIFERNIFQSFIVVLSNLNLLNLKLLNLNRIFSAVLWLNGLIGEVCKSLVLNGIFLTELREFQRSPFCSFEIF
jgi:hypothetical protein